MQGMPVTDYSGADMTNENFRSSDIQQAHPVQQMRPRKKSERKKYVRGQGRVREDNEGDDEYEDPL